MRQQIRFDLVIPNGDDESNEWKAGTDGATKLAINNIVDLVIVAPGTLDGGTTYTVHVAAPKNPVAADYAALQVAGSDVTLTTDKATQIPVGAFKALKIVASANVGAARTFQCIAQIDTSV